MRQVLHDIEKKIITALDGGEMTSEQLITATGLSADQIRRGMEWLRLKGLASIREERREFISLGSNGLQALSDGLPERRLLDLLGSGSTVSELREKLGNTFGPAMGIARRNGWVHSDSDRITPASKPEAIPGEAIIVQIGKGKIPKSDVGDSAALDELCRRPDFIVETVSKSKSVSLLEGAAELGEDQVGGAIDVEADAPAVYPARTHPLNETIAEIREIFVSLGFAEIVGNLAQSSFWNFDALFTPQDHPARDMHDTFYLDGVIRGRPATTQQMSGVASSHRRGWGYEWNPARARRAVLRTHTTCVTIRHLAEHRPDEARVFSLGRVFRNEKVSYKHLAEFNQVEGVVVGSCVSLRDLMGIQTEFYRRLGLGRVQFWPTFFPYTEPSLQTMVYNERLGKWVEMFGMGIFRPEVTKPLGITKPVLAWGGGIERIAMMRYGIDDVREFYNNDIKWLRGAQRCR